MNVTHLSFIGYILLEWYFSPEVKVFYCSKKYTCGIYSTVYAHSIYSKYIHIVTCKEAFWNVSVKK